MSNFAKGKDYEDFVEQVYQAILSAEQRNQRISFVALERNKTIQSWTGTPAEIDIYWEYTVAGITHKVAIECKNYNKVVDIGEIRDFSKKIEHIGGLKGLMAAKQGFSLNSIQQASAENIDLLIIRDPEPADWDGRLMKINIALHAITPARILQISPTVDKAWMLQNGYKVGDEVQFGGLSNQVFIEERAEGFKHSLHDLENHNFFEDNGVGTHTWIKSFKDGWIHNNERSIKIISIQIDYQGSSVSKSEVNIDFEKYVLAIMEYVNGHQQKQVILKSGEKKPY